MHGDERDPRNPRTHRGGGDGTARPVSHAPPPPQRSFAFFLTPRCRVVSRPLRALLPRSRGPPRRPRAVRRGRRAVAAWRRGGRSGHRHHEDEMNLLPFFFFFFFLSRTPRPTCLPSFHLYRESLEMQDAGPAGYVAVSALPLEGARTPAAAARERVAEGGRRDAAASGDSGVPGHPRGHRRARFPSGKTRPCPPLRGAPAAGRRSQPGGTARPRMKTATARAGGAAADGAAGRAGGHAPLKKKPCFSHCRNALAPSRRIYFCHRGSRKPPQRARGVWRRRRRRRGRTRRSGASVPPSLADGRWASLSAHTTARNSGQQKRT